MEKITKNELYNTLEKFKGARQYYYEIVSDDLEEYIDAIDFDMVQDIEEHISDKYRVIKDITILSNGFKINDSAYYFVGKTDIYKIDKKERTYIILHKPDTNNIMIYENLSKKASETEKDRETFIKQMLTKEKSIKELLGVE